MNCIQKIEIRHFRSINRLSVDELSDVNVFSGLNDVGKSNVIKALNLFFNNQVDWQSELDFERDTNSYRSHYSKKGSVRKYISVKLTFAVKRGRYTSIGTRDFWIERQWDINNLNRPIQTWGKVGMSKPSVERPRGLTDFLKACHFFYVPAIRSQGYLRDLLRQFSMAITEESDPDLKTASTELSTVLRSRSSDLREILKDVTGVGMSLELPQTMLALLEAAGLTTDGDIPLEMRGDGIQSLTVAAILTYLSSRRAKAYYFWGFEEPENSLEYIRASAIAEQIQRDYSRRAQIFLSTHSPAFLAMSDETTTIYRVSTKPETYQKTGHTEDVTVIRPVSVNGIESDQKLLPEELGFFDVIRKIDKEYKDFECLKHEVSTLRSQLDYVTEPTLIVEGQNDKQVLQHAWNRLYTNKMPFTIFDAGGVSKVSELVKQLIRIPMNRRICALYDHDLAGIQSIEKLSGNDFGENHRRKSLDFIEGDLKMMTLLTPDVPCRVKQAENLNLVIEHYFSDSLLLQIDRDSGNDLFNPRKHVLYGEHPDIDEDSLRILIDSGQKTIVHRALKRRGRGKQLLVKSLRKLEVTEFLSFNRLFETIVAHLSPNLELELRAKAARHLIRTESR